MVWEKEQDPYSALHFIIFTNMKGDAESSSGWQQNHHAFSKEDIDPFSINNLIYVCPKRVVVVLSSSSWSICFWI